jgi:hypothetical protein
MLVLHSLLSKVIIIKCMCVRLLLLLDMGVGAPKYKAFVPRSSDKQKLRTMEGVLDHQHEGLK